MLLSIWILLIRFCGEGYNWNQVILHADIYLRKQPLEILIREMIMMQAESYMLDTLLGKFLYSRFRIGTIFIFLTSSPPIYIYALLQHLLIVLWSDGRRLGVCYECYQS